MWISTFHRRAGGPSVGHVLPGDDTAPERFLIELDQGASSGDPALLTQRARQAAQARADGTSIRHVRTIYVPEDGSSYLLVEAGSAAEIVGALREVGLEPRSVEPAIRAATAGLAETGSPGLPTGRGQTGCAGPAEASPPPDQPTSPGADRRPERRPSRAAERRSRA